MGCGASVVPRYVASTTSEDGQQLGPIGIGLLTLGGVPVPEEFQRQGSQIAETEHRGISIAQLELLSALCRSVFARGTCIDSHSGQNVEWQTASKYNVNEFITMPLTAPFVCSTVELVAQKSQHPTWFVSHSWSHSLRETVEILAFHAEARKLAESVCSYYWICTFANNQHNLGELAGALENTPFFKAMMLDCCRGTIALVCEEALLFSRIWCLYESYVSMEVTQSLGKAHLYDVGALSTGYICAPIEIKAGVVIQLDVGDGSHEEVSTVKKERYDQDLHCNAGKPGVVVKPAMSLPAGTHHPASVARVANIQSLLGEVVVPNWHLPAPPVFPIHSGSAAMKVDIAAAQASRIEDQENILHLVAGSPPSARNERPPAKHENYNRLNRCIRSRFAMSALTAAVCVGNTAKVEELTSMFPGIASRPNTIKSNASTCMHSAAIWGHVEVLRCLLAARANVDAANTYGTTPLWFAVLRGHTKFVAELLTLRAEIELAGSAEGCEAAGIPSLMELARLRGADDECASLLLSSPLP